MKHKVAKILLVEDDPTQRLALGVNLVNEGFVVYNAKNGEEGLLYALGEHPDVILLDIVMPKMNGFEMIKQLRADEWGKNAKIIILTNSPDLQNVEKSINSEVYEYIIKSDTTTEKIIQKVRDLLLV